ncbi:hypothetical protein BV22DRAFT_1117146 [Leucogyrophana mollusca]|uniref:Uncharacterized protein n=1 Tax=Leucogyrophana mollusca TaxID=85980 RepID=A0ACB8BU46_9AGAM|nr:hypothetical protein BV22DRAFT_1117146 [Leucogyrophana mollusca]
MMDLHLLEGLPGERENERHDRVHGALALFTYWLTTHPPPKRTANPRRRSLSPRVLNPALQKKGMSLSVPPFAEVMIARNYSVAQADTLLVLQSRWGVCSLNGFRLGSDPSIGITALEYRRQLSSMVFGVLIRADTQPPRHHSAHPAGFPTQLIELIAPSSLEVRGDFDLISPTTFFACGRHSVRGRQRRNVHLGNWHLLNGSRATSRGMAKKEIVDLGANLRKSVLSKNRVNIRVKRRTTFQAPLVGSRDEHRAGKRYIQFMVKSQARIYHVLGIDKSQDWAN